MKPLLDDRSRALIKLGLLRPIDLGFLGIIILAVFLTISWAIFGQPTLLAAIAIAVALLWWTILWLVVLVYRCALMVLETRAEIGTMPETAARLVQRFNLGIRHQGPPAGV